MLAPGRDLPGGFHDVQRRLAVLLPDGNWIDSPPTLELSSIGAVDAPRLIAATLLEDSVLGAHDIAGPPVARFAAFLDGTQRSRVIAHAGELPIVHGSVAAAVRRRVDRRMRAWDKVSPIVSEALYAPLAMLPAPWRAALGQAGVPLVDTLEGRQPGSGHPFALRDAAIHAIQDAREAAERALAERWCATESAELFVDGAITASERVATSERVVGVVKSHHTLYADGEALRTVLRLRAGERSSAFRVTSPKRTPVASWYLRLRDPRGRDPLWGLVRVEIAESERLDAATLGERANEVSRWVLAEAYPLALPDARWDTMTYGIHDCEEFLRAIQ